MVSYADCIIINMEDYINMLMVKQVLNMDLNSSDMKKNMESLNNLNTLKKLQNTFKNYILYILFSEIIWKETN